VKPDEGSLGTGIILLCEGDALEMEEQDYVAQDYIKSLLVNNRKFDLRLYVLVSSLDPLMIWLYHEGEARFASLEADVDSKYAYLTNTTMNAQNPEGTAKELIRMVSDVFAELREQGVNTDVLWEELEHLALVSMMAVLGKMIADAPDSPWGRSRAFHVFGLDVLLDEHLKPWILEINARPMMDDYGEEDYKFIAKLTMDWSQICLPRRRLQKFMDRMKSIPPAPEFKEMVSRKPRILWAARRMIGSNNLFQKLWPMRADGANRALYERILEYVKSTTDNAKSAIAGRLFDMPDPMPRALQLVSPVRPGSRTRTRRRLRTPATATATPLP
jgi:hypothetical protein